MDVTRFSVTDLIKIKLLSEYFHNEDGLSMLKVFSKCF